MLGVLTHVFDHVTHDASPVSALPRPFLDEHIVDSSVYARSGMKDEEIGKADTARSFPGVKVADQTLAIDRALN